MVSQMQLYDRILFQIGEFCDNYEMTIAKRYYDNNISTLDICCGHNIIVRSLVKTGKQITNDL